jgi:phospholipase D1/2
MSSTRSHARPPAGPPDNGSGPRAGSAIVFLLPVLALAAVVAIWQFTDLHTFDAERFTEVARKLRESPAGLAYTVLVFSVGTLLFLPVTPLVLGTFFAFGPLRGFIYAVIGVLVAAAVTYGAGRLLGSAAVERLSGPRLAKLSRELHANAFRAGIIMRILPVGHFTVINLLAGSLRIPFRWYLLGNTAGITISLLFVALFADRLLQAVRSPDALSIALAAGCLVLLGVLALLARRALKRRAQRLDPGASDP